MWVAKIIYSLPMYHDVKIDPGMHCCLGICSVRSPLLHCCESLSTSKRCAHSY